MHRPDLHPCFRAHTAGPESVYLVSEQDVVLLRGRPYASLAPLLDGRRTTGELIRSLAGELSAAEVHYTLGKLAEKGYLADGEDHRATSPGAEVRTRREEAYWHLQGLDPCRVRQRLESSVVDVVDLAGLGAVDFGQALASAGLRSSDDGGATVTVVAAGDYLDPELTRLDAELRQRERPWMLVKPFGAEPWIGPIFVPGVTACHECLANRLRAHRRLRGLLAREAGESAAFRYPTAGLDSTVELVLRLAATELARWLAAEDAASSDAAVIALDLRRLATARHQLVRRPQCRRCGDPRTMSRRGFVPVELESRPAAFRTDGGYRVRDPEDTVRRLAHHVSPITGVVRELRPFEGGDEVLRAYRSGPNVALEGRDFEELRGWLRHTSSGKGKSDAQARASALCEAVERYSSAFHGDEPRQLARRTELGEAAVHPHDVLGFSRRQYRQRERINRRSADRRSFVPRPFDDDAAVEWTPLWSLPEGRRRYLPTACCYLGYASSSAARGPSGFARGDSNGTAAGNTLEEAILQGFLELVERDAVALWWYHRLRRPAVDLASFEEPWFELVRRHHERLGRSLVVLDVTSDLGIPVFVALSVAETGAGIAGVAHGFGAHLDPCLAASRALSEANQMLLTALAGAPVRAELDAGRQPWERVDLAAHPHLEAAPGPPRGAYPRHRSTDLRQDVLTCLERAARQGLETLVLDQTRPDVGLHVAKVVVPGLRHFWPRFAPGRLYDVPVKMGWLAEPRREEELNPSPPFF